jgi:hypothetical protein
MQRLYAMIVVEWKELNLQRENNRGMYEKKIRNRKKVICKRKTEKDFREFKILQTQTFLFFFKKGINSGKKLKVAKGIQYLSFLKVVKNVK